MVIIVDPLLIVDVSTSPFDFTGVLLNGLKNYSECFS